MPDRRERLACGQFFLTLYWVAPCNLHVDGLPHLVASQGPFFRVPTTRVLAHWNQYWDPKYSATSHLGVSECVACQPGCEKATFGHPVLGDAALTAQGRCHSRLQGPKYSWFAGFMGRKYVFSYFLMRASAAQHNAIRTLT